MSEKIKDVAKDAAISGTIKAAPGILSSFFSFIRSVFGGKSAKEAAKDLGEDLTNSAETITTEVVTEVTDEVSKDK